MTDIKLNSGGDIEIGSDGDIALTESVTQAAKIRLQWFLDEWRFNPEAGLPYFEDVFIKNPNLDKIKSLMRSELLAVDGVLAVPEITIDIAKEDRTALIRFKISTDEETYTEEVELNA